MQCQVVYLYRNRCLHSTFRKAPVCFWHNFMSGMRSDYANQPWGAQAVMAGTALDVYLAAYCFSRLYSEYHFAWLIGLLFVSGSALKLLSDGVTALDYPLSQFAFWGKALFLGMWLEIIAAPIYTTPLAMSSTFALPLLEAWSGNAD